MIKNPILRTALFTLGVISLVLGFIGVFLPLLPTTPFVLLSAWCFLRSSERAHQWIYRQPLLGGPLRNWEQNRSISRRVKVLAISMILVSLAVIWLKVGTPLAVKIPLTILLLSVSTFIATRNEVRAPEQKNDNSLSS